MRSSNSSSSSSSSQRPLSIWVSEAEELNVLLAAAAACCWGCFVLLRVVVLRNAVRYLHYCGLPTAVPLRGLLAQVLRIFCCIVFIAVDCCTQRMC